MEDYRKKFQELLRRLFQFESADLDFGIYRIMNYKRDVIEKFIEKDLLNAVAAELNQGALAEQKETESKIQDIASEIKEKLAEDAINGDGNLKPQYVNTKLGKDYGKWKEIQASYGKHAAHEPEIFNHLYTFFSRYYDNGDFMSKRRYSKKEKYAIPYNGEEVHLHWANSDQYYIKTGEYFTDFTFRSGDIAVHFKLQAAQVEKENIKGDKRFFIPLIKQASYSADVKQVVIPFEYRPLTEKETISYGQKNQQDTIITEALDKIQKHFKSDALVIDALMAERRRTSDGRAVSYLEHHLYQYASRNTSDFFIHKDLKGFLTRELDFYIKNEVINLDELEASGEPRTEGWFQMMRVIRNIGHKVIAFLASIEEFQKKLFEKKKFIIDTQYCIAVQNIAEEFYPAIAANEAQWGEWKEQLHIDEGETNLFTAGKNKRDKRLSFLKSHPTLMLDTKYYEQNFVDHLLASFEDLDAITDGILINSENYQALNVLLNKYRAKVNCIYIDPPYNTSENTFLYKNSYKHSSWISMISNRLALGRQLLTMGGVIEVAIDDTETSYLRNLLDSLFGEGNRVATIAAEVNPAGQNLRPNTPALSHDYCHVYAADISQMDMLLRELTDEEMAAYDEKDSTGDYLWDNLRRRGGNSRPADRPGQWFPLFITENTVRVPEMEWDESGKKWLLKEKPHKGEVEVWPIDPKGEKRIWRVNPDGARKFIKKGDIAVMYKAGRQEVVKKSYMPEGRKPKTLWKDPKYSATTYGSKLLIDILGKQLFSYPKSLYLEMDCLRFWVDEGAIVLDFFAGSGTTGHAIVSLNREDGGNRKFILVEMGEYFDSVLLSRIKKVTYTPEWKGGAPVRQVTRDEAKCSPRIVKYMQIESYEDSLNNIMVMGTGSQKAFQFDDYLINYMIGEETKGSDTFLNIDKVISPFSYQLTVQQEGQLRTIPVDLMETFAYLLGLHVRKRTVQYDEKKRYVVYRGSIDSRAVVVIWRDIKDWTKDDFERDKKFVVEKKITEDADELFVNGDSVIPNARSLDPIFKSRMFAPIAAGNGGF